jgi:hypothetical protein
MLGTLWAAATPSMNEQGLQISNGLRYEWLAFPVAIAIGLWVWAAIVVTRRQVTTRQGPYYFFKQLSRFQKNQKGITQVVVVGGLCLFIVGLFWIVFTLPTSSTITSMGGVSAFASDAQATVTFIDIFIGAMPIIAGIIVMAWGFTRTIEERETGVSSV